jgi:hypothetical protein
MAALSETSDLNPIVVESGSMSTQTGASGWRDGFESDALRECGGGNATST